MNEGLTLSHRRCISCDRAAMLAMQCSARSINVRQAQQAGCSDELISTVICDSLCALLFAVCSLLFCA